MIDRLHIHHVRNITHSELQMGAVNLFIGDNGSGKTSILEALFLLSRGKSFRHHQPKHYINHNQDHCTVWVKLTDDSTFAIQKHSDASTILRHNHQSLASQSELTKLLPTTLIDPVSMSLLEEGSSTRRQLLDWLAFHVSPAFFAAWQGYNRLLKQRNALLKSSPYAHREITAWDMTLSHHAAALHEARLAVFAEWQTHFEQVIALLLPHYHGSLRLNYHAGFDTRTPLHTILAERLEQDIALGYTRIGAHRADLSISLKTTLANGQYRSEQAVNILSRGEKKLLITALRLSQLPPLCATNDVNTLPMVLIDDIDAELDDTAIRLLISNLLALPCQLFISSLNPHLTELMQSLAPAEHRVQSFVVQDGTIKHAPQAAAKDYEQSNLTTPTPKTLPQNTQTTAKQV